MLARQSPFGRLLFGRIPGAGAVAFCALTAGWIAGQHAPLLLGRGEDGSSISLSPALPPLTPEHESKAPVFPREQEARASDGPPATPLIGATPQSSLLSPDLLSQQDRDLTGLAQAIAFYKSGELAQGDAAAAAAKDR